MYAMRTYFLTSLGNNIWDMVRVSLTAVGVGKIATSRFNFQLFFVQIVMPGGFNVFRLL